mmetsp:Transcript_92167/g.232588  ORF Transcript_92167/g.232588 Transcript_92167/m.232588 type:complete len:231 (+) Transcript_92167:300-992(+)
MPRPETTLHSRTSESRSRLRNLTCSRRVRSSSSVQSFARPETQRRCTSAASLSPPPPPPSPSRRRSLARSQRSERFLESPLRLSLPPERYQPLSVPCRTAARKSMRALCSSSQVSSELLALSMATRYCTTRLSNSAFLSLMLTNARAPPSLTLLRLPEAQECSNSSNSSSPPSWSCQPWPQPPPPPSPKDRSDATAAAGFSDARGEPPAAPPSRGGSARTTVMGSPVTSG